MIGREDLIGDPRFDTQAARLEHEREVDEMIAAWTRQHEKREAMRLLGSAGVPAGAIFDTMELTEEADFERRGIMQTMQHPTIGAFKMQGWPVRFGGRTPQVKPAPLLGQTHQGRFARMRWSTAFSIRRATTCCGRSPRAKWALKVRNARHGWHLEIPAVQLITPNLPDAANYETERERGQDFESHQHC